MINQPSIAILIDCWNLSGSNFPIGDRILKFLDNNTAIETVILASYNCREEISSNYLWYRNNRDYFFNEKNSRKIKDLYHIHRIYNKHNTRFQNEYTHPVILNYVNHNKFQISMQWGWELEYYLEMNPYIKNVYVLGIAWDVCVKVRPLGYDALSEIKNINVLTNVECVKYHGILGPICLDHDNNWYKVEDKIYCKNKNNYKGILNV